MSNWYRLSNTQVQQTLPALGADEKKPQQCDPSERSAPEPPPAAVDQVVKDFLHGENIERIADVRTAVKTAGVTGHFRHKMFIRAFSELPNHMKDFVRQNFKKMIVNPSSVELKPINAHRKSNISVYSAQVGADYRALAVRIGNYYVWYWIGKHGAYDRQCERMPPAMSAPPQPVPTMNVSKPEMDRVQNGNQKSKRPQMV